MKTTESPKVRWRGIVRSICIVFLFMGIAICIIWAVEEGLYPTGYNSELTDKGKYILERGVIDQETLVVKDDESDGLQLQTALTHNFISTFQYTFSLMSITLLSFVITVVSFIRSKKKQSETQLMNLFSIILLFVTSIVSIYITSSYLTDIEDNWDGIEQQLEESRDELSIQSYLQKRASQNDFS